MTYVATTANFTHTTDAEFQTWSTAVHNALIAAGLIQTSDTGQVDLSTAVRPGTSAYAGYRIYRFNDTLQATAPLFVKVEYGTLSTATIPALRVQVGTGTNGAGTLTGRFTTAAILGASGTGALVSDIRVATGLDKSYLAFYWSIGQASAVCGGGLVVDRSRNSDGTPNADGAYVLTYGGSSASNQIASMLSNTGAGASTTTAAFCYGGPIGTGVQGTDVSFFPHMCFTPKAQAPVKPILGYWAGDIGYGSTVTVPHYGNAPYFCMGNRVIHGGSNGTASTSNISVAFRAE